MLQLNHDDKAPIEDEGEWVRRVYGDRCQYGKDVREEQPPEPTAIFSVQIFRLQDLDPGSRHLLSNLAPAGLLVSYEAGGKAVNGAKLLGRCKPILRKRLHAG